MASKASASRKAFGDWQTPAALTQQVVEVVRGLIPLPACVLEPTCGEGTFLQAAARAFANVPLYGFEVSPEYVAKARARLPVDRTAISTGDFFQLPWSEIMATLPDPILILGNPPWVTNATQGTFNTRNLPTKRNFHQHKGLDALTGKSNFDISLWMLLHLLQAVRGRAFCLAMLCKAAVARGIMQHANREGWAIKGEVRSIDARMHFDAAVDAVLLIIQGHPTSAFVNRWPVYASLQEIEPKRHMGVVNGRSYSDLDAYNATLALEGGSAKQWRSGIKHDCASVMELQHGAGGVLVNQLGDRVPLDRNYLFPLLKGSDLAKGQVSPRRYVIVPQRHLGENTSELRGRSPKLWSYLQSHKVRLQARKSRIYVNQPEFAIFGVGEYSFSPYKVAICGLYKSFVFTVVPPFEGQPVMVDDTAYFLPCETAEEAESIAAALRSPAARAFFEARVFWDAKRPINKELLQSLSLDSLCGALSSQPSAEIFDRSSKTFF